MASTPVSPKVPASTAGGAVGTLLAFLVDSYVPWPDYAQAALIVVLMAVGAFLAGWWKSDPLRNLGAKFDHNAKTQ